MKEEGFSPDESFVNEEGDSWCDLCTAKCLSIVSWITGFCAMLIGAIITGLVFSDFTVLQGWTLAPNQTHLWDISYSQSQLCDGIKLKLASTAYVDPPLQLYFVDDVPALSMNYSFSMVRNFEVDANSNNYWTYEMHTNSTANVTTSTVDAISFFVFKGHNNFVDWLDYSGTNWVVRIDIDSGDDDVNYFLPPVEEDWYYFVWNNYQPFSANVTMVMDMFRTEYNTSGAERSCNADPSCTLSLKFSKSQNAVIQTLGSQSEDDNVQVQAYCQSRVLFEIGIWFGSLAAWTLLIGGLYLCWTRCCQRRRKQVIRSIPKDSSLLWDAD
jgi:hypothetical protein